MAFERFVKVTIVRAMDINSNTSMLKGRSMVFAKVSYQNLVYTTTQVKDMGQNPVWEDDGTNVCHFEFTNTSEYITLQLYNRNDATFIGECKLQLSEVLRLSPGIPEPKTLPVMMKQRHAGQVEVKVELMEHKAMGDLGALLVEIKKGEIPKLTSFLVKTATISAKLIYKHTTYTTGVLEKAGNKFVWHSDNTFIFIINSFSDSSDDILKLEIYNSQLMVGECKVSLSVFIEDKHLRGHPSDWVAHTPEVCLPGKKCFGNIEMRARFTSKMPRRRSDPMYHHPSPSTHGHHPSPSTHGHHPSPSTHGHHPYSPPVQQPWPPHSMPDPFLPQAPFPTRFPQPPRPHSPPPDLYPPQAPPQAPPVYIPRPHIPPGPTMYPPPHNPHGHGGRPPCNPPPQPFDQTFIPSAPCVPQGLPTAHAYAYAYAHGAPDPRDDKEIGDFMSSFH